MFRISKDSPVYYLTSVAHDRLPVFKTAKLKTIACNALNEARTSASLLIFAYVVMPDHLHALIGSQRKPSEVLRYVNGISGHRVINYLKEKGFYSSLQKLQRESGSRQHKYSLWDHHPNLRIQSELAWWNEQKIIAGLAFGVGNGDRWKMNLFWWILIRSIGTAAEAKPRNIE